ncbi:core protein [Salmonella enterica]|nr:core protein [Salmonella enterica]
MIGKPAARQGDMTQVGGPIVQGSAGVLIGAPTGVACSVCPGGITYGSPVNPLSGPRCCRVRRILRCPARCRLCFPAPTAATGPGRPRRQDCSVPAGRCWPICACSFASGS